jgi:hypothetical protein
LGFGLHNSGGIQLRVSVLSACNDMLAVDFSASEKLEVLSVLHSATEVVASAIRRPMSLALAIFVQFAFWVAPASAQLLASDIREFGLFGIWADDCNANPGPSNQYASFSITSRGTIMLRNDFGPDYGDMIYRIVDARRIGQFKISLRQLLTTDDRVALDTVMLKAKDKVRIWSSRGADGSEYLQDGRISAANNHETGWMEHCNTRWAGDLNSVHIERDLQF